MVAWDATSWVRAVRQMMHPPHLHFPPGNLLQITSCIWLSCSLTHNLQAVPKRGEEPEHDALEKALLKTATRGVVRLFNAVSKAQRDQKDAVVGGSRSRVSPFLLAGDWSDVHCNLQNCMHRCISFWVMALPVLSLQSLHIPFLYLCLAHMLSRIVGSRLYIGWS